MQGDDYMERQINRDYTLDGLKFLLICLVVLGHFIQGARYNNEITTAIYSVIYNFHMPLFVLLSGYSSMQIALVKLTYLIERF